MTATKELNGLKFNRYFSTEKEFIWDTVDWETRTASIIGSDGTIIFEQAGVEVPKSWSQLATNVVVSKYFRGHVGTLEREYSVKQLIGRVADRILEWGIKGNYFASTEDSEVFHDELRYILLHQMAAFNSPVWFNLGWEGRRQAVSACYINEVEDTMESILDLYKTEGLLFKDGSGSGVNLSILRSSKDKISAGGKSSGPLSFMKGLDASAGSIKSGGSCLAPWTLVYTENGPVEVSSLINKPFIVLSYDPPVGRYKAKNASAWKSGHKKIVKLTTDKGSFDLSYDHPIRLSNGTFVPCGELKSGQSLFHCKIDDNQGYLRVGLRRGHRTSDGHKKLHQLIKEDILLNTDTTKVVHHKDKNKYNNSIENLELITQEEHAFLHTKELVETNNHIFQTTSFSHKDENNGMHSSSKFWEDETKVAKYKNGQSRLLVNSGRASSMAKEASRVKMLNKAYDILSHGYTLKTPEDYFIGATKIGRRCSNKKVFLRDINNTFGSFNDFTRELSLHNHKVVSIEEIGVFDVYDVEVVCPTVDDKSINTGHNFVIWPNKEYTGSGICIANTRRAACMRLLDIDHPDIKDFIDCKKDAELKAHALIDAGYSGAFNVTNGAYDTVPFQNANHSVRVTDKFMQAVEAGSSWETKFSLTGKTAEKIKAKELLHRIAEATWVCGDPGLQYDTTINDWHTCSITDRIYASNPCSEYIFLNSTACNLASLNLMKFRDSISGDFDVISYESAIKILITAQEIMVGFADYPTEKIKQRSHEFRTLGLGYANLGALLMAAGIPYDSDLGRAYTGAITALTTGISYVQSARIAEFCGGPFSEYLTNQKPMLKVIQKHRDSISKINSKLVPESLLESAQNSWDLALNLGKTFGFRNAQVTVLAPTGTIGFLMDCDTTGIEPDIAIVKYKNLVGGGVMKLVNQTVPEALTRLEYTTNEIESILKFIEENDTIEGAPDLRSEHLPIFDCAFRPMNGTRSISYKGHIRMMAAAQPFISGAISKTVNVPENCTIEEIAETYIEAWKLGIKAVAIYRDNSKRTQPLSTSKADINNSKTQIALREERIKLPDEREAITHKFSIAGHEGYITVGLYPETKTPGEIFIHMAKEGSSISGLMDSFATAISLSLQYGVPLQTLVNKFIHSRFEPSGFTNNKEIPIAKSVMDYIFRWLALKFIKSEEIPVEIESTMKKENKNKQEIFRVQSDAPPCPDCGSFTVRNGACYKCLVCGTSLGCS